MPDATLTARERFRRTMRFEPVDRAPMLEWATWWDQTIDAWRAQGLTWPPLAGLSDGAALQRAFGLDLHLQSWFRITTEATPRPAFHGAPLVRNLAEYEKILPTLYPAQPFDPQGVAVHAAYQARGEAIAWCTLEGFFWGPRRLLGIEPHLYAFYDEPELIHRINEDLVRYHLRALDQYLAFLTPDFMTFAEDMSYNNGPMISEALFDEFMLPYYQALVPALKARGIRVFIDSDGDIARAAPWFLRAGIEGILPLERQAGVDLSALRVHFPQMLFIGPFDKMCMPHGEQAMRAEFERLLPVMRQGGFVASVDHQTPPGVSLAHYRTYLKLYREYSERAAREA